MQIKSIYDTKLIVLDLDFYLISSFDFDTTLSIQKMLTKIGASQTLVIVTNSNNKETIKIIDSWNLKSGFVITNSGCSVYNIALKKNIYEHTFSEEQSKVIIKSCIWNNLNFIIHTNKGETYVYRINNWFFQKYKTELNRIIFFEKNVLNDWKKICEVLKDTTVTSIEIFFHEEDNRKRNEKIQQFTENLCSASKFNFSINECVLYVYPNKISKFLGVSAIANSKSITLSENSLYMGINQYDDEIIDSSFFSVVSGHLNLKAKQKNKIITIPFVSDIEWIYWLEQFSYLWEEPVEKKIKNLLQFVKYNSITEYEYDQIINNKNKQIFLNETDHEIYLNNSVFKRKIRWIPNFDKKEKIIKKIFLWPSHAKWFLSFIAEKKYLNK